ncbi:MAG: hypothetical protein J2P31_01435, partial [Blastocatellia bacterium]|nr:hypothetical protein [Blastocatellia bacterium]
LDCVRQWLNDSALKAEERFKTRLAEVRAEARQEAEAEFQEMLKKAARDWDNAQKRANEIELGKQLEELRAQVAKELEQEFEQRLSEQNSGLPAQMLEDAEIQQRLAQACAEAAAVARRESEDQIEELREQLEASRKALTLAVSTSSTPATDAGGIDLVKTAIVEIDQQRSQSETLATLVKRASDFAPRLVFFVIRGGEAVGWRAKGFENGLADDTVRQLTVPTQNPGLLHDALANFSTAVCRSANPSDGSTVLGRYGTPAPEYSIAIPLVVRGKAAAVLYADSGTHAENSVNTSAIETLMRVAGMAVELLPARRGSEPARTAVQAPTTPVTAPMPPRPGPPAAMGSTTPISPITAPVTPLAAPLTTAPVATPTVASQESGLFKTPGQAAGQTAGQPQARTEPAKPLEKEIEQAKRVGQVIEAQPFVKPEWAVRVRTTEELIKPRQLPESWAEPDDQRRPGLAAEPFPGRSDSGGMRSNIPAKTDETKKTAEEPSIQDSAPRQQPPVFSSVPTPASETEQRSHNDARRFARLLVSEIKLYNASKVNDGRRNFDLYDRLKDEIDRSRKVYDKRVVPSVASRFDYFYDELVQTLAEGDPAKLGPNSPGPVVLTT